MSDEKSILVYLYRRSNLFKVAIKSTTDILTEYVTEYYLEDKSQEVIYSLLKDYDESYEIVDVIEIDDVVSDHKKTENCISKDRKRILDKIWNKAQREVIELPNNFVLPNNFEVEFKLELEFTCSCGENEECSNCSK